MSKIEWCDLTWNPVWGCLNGCPYCYARKMANRFYKKMADKENHYCSMKYNDYMVDGFLALNLENFHPTWLESNYDKSFPEKPKRIFVNSMSDIKFWEQEWMIKVNNKIKEYSQHTFLFLTKYPAIYDKYIFSDNCILGITITKQQDMKNLADLIFTTTFDDKHKIFLSIEPMLERIYLLVMPDWIVIGAETGNRKNKIIPEPEWIESLISGLHIPVFIKNNVWEYYKCFKQEFPK